MTQDHNAQKAFAATLKVGDTIKVSWKSAVQTNMVRWSGVVSCVTASDSTTHAPTSVQVDYGDLGTWPFPPTHQCDILKLERVVNNDPWHQAMLKASAGSVGGPDAKNPRTWGPYLENNPLGQHQLMMWLRTRYGVSQREITQRASGQVHWKNHFLLVLEAWVAQSCENPSWRDEKNVKIADLIVLRLEQVLTGEHGGDVREFAKQFEKITAEKEHSVIGKCVVASQKSKKGGRDAQDGVAGDE